MANRVCLFCSYSEDDSISLYVRRYLEELRKYHSRIVFITNSRDISAESIGYLEKNGFSLRQFKNEGYDFGMWAKAIALERLDSYDEISLVNDSCVLVGDFLDFFSWFETMSLDFSALSDNYEIAYHLQSFFMIFRSEAFSCLANYLALQGAARNKVDTVLRFEVGVSRHLFEKGFQGAAYFECGEYGRLGANLTVYRPLAIIKEGFPLVKKSILSISCFSSFYRFSLRHKIGEAELSQIPKKRLTLHSLYHEGIDRLLYATIGAKLLPRVASRNSNDS